MLSTEEFSKLTRSLIPDLRGCIPDLTSLQLVCKKFHRLARDGEVWKALCFHGSVAGRRHNRATIPKTIPSRQVQVLQAEAAAVTSSTVERTAAQSADELLQTRVRVQEREIARWDPRYSGEDTNWYREYVAREAQIDVQWARASRPGDTFEIEGVALHKDTSGSQYAVSRYDDGFVGIWDLRNRASSFLRTARPILKGGYPSTYDGISQDKASLAQSAINESISIDRARQKAYIAVDCQLNEVDLNTLQVSACTTLPRPISALSNVPTHSPLIVGTAAGLYRHDARVPPRWFDGSQVLHHQLSLNQPATAPGPMLSLSILQTTSSGFGSGLGSSSAGPGEIYAAGRYPSILVYDQRTFPRIRHSVWSGASLSSLALIPAILPQIPRHVDLAAGESSQQSVEVPPGHTLLAGGSKNGKGSLELYGMVAGPGGEERRPEYGNVRNRTMASRVTLLSVAAHGKRICASDADGNIKWFERDAFNLVRQINANELLAASAAAGTGTVGNGAAGQAPGSSPPPRRPSAGSGGLFGTVQDNGDVVQKVIPLAKREDAELLVWAGSRVGVLGFGRKPEADPAAAGEGDGSEDERAEAARKYEEHMRRLLEAQAVEARRMQDFGLE